MTVSLDDIKQAQEAISPVATGTPLLPSSFLSEFCGTDFYLKLETMQPIGAFKIRGALNAVINLPEDIRGVACCSTGNHGRGVAYAARQRGLTAVVFMSSLVPQTKIDGIRALGAEVRITGKSQDEAYLECTKLVESGNFADISPFDDRYVIAGQGTIGLELMEALPELGTILVPLSGGGLAGGIALAAKSVNPDVRVIGISMDRGAAMHQSIRAGHPVEVEEMPSLADSLGGGIGDPNQYSLSLCKQYLDETILVSEDEIYDAMQTLYFEDRLIVEGSSAVSIAAVKSSKIKNLKGPVAAVISGRNVDMTLFTQIVSGQPVKLGDKEIAGRKYSSARE